MKHTTEDLLFTLELCRRNLPAETNLVHFERLTEIEMILRVREKNLERRKANV